MSNSQPYPSIPKFWVVKRIEDYLSTVRKGSVKTIGESAGGRPLHVYLLGKKKNVKRTASFTSAVVGRNPSAFYGRNPQNSRSIFFLCGIHGHEPEGVASAINLIEILETGKDLRGKEWCTISGLQDEYRIAIIPLANPDGRSRCPDSLNGMTKTQLAYYGWGTWKSGKLIGCRESFSHFPLPLDRVGFLGGYFNDNGVNIHIDTTPGFTISSEAKVIFQIMRSEMPQCFLQAHSCQMSPSILPPGRLLSKPFREKVNDFREAIRDDLEAKGLRPLQISRKDYDSELTGFTINAFCHYLCGCLPLIFESPHGIQENPYTLDEILDINLTVFARVMILGCQKGFIPGSLSVDVSGSPVGK